MQSRGARQSSSSSAGHPAAPVQYGPPPPEQGMGFPEQQDLHQAMFVSVGAHVTTQSPTVYHSAEQSGEHNISQFGGQPPMVPSVQLPVRATPVNISEIQEGSIDEPGSYLPPSRTPVPVPVQVQARAQTLSPFPFHHSHHSTPYPTSSISLSLSHHPFHQTPTLCPSIIPSSLRPCPIHLHRPLHFSPQAPPSSLTQPQCCSPKSRISPGLSLPILCQSRPHLRRPASMLTPHAQKTSWPTFSHMSHQKCGVR